MESIGSWRVTSEISTCVTYMRKIFLPVYVRIGDIFLPAYIYTGNTEMRNVYPGKWESQSQGGQGQESHRLHTRPKNLNGGSAVRVLGGGCAACGGAAATRRAAAGGDRQPRLSGDGSWVSISHLCRHRVGGCGGTPRGSVSDRQGRVWRHATSERK